MTKEIPRLTLDRTRTTDDIYVVAPEEENNDFMSQINVGPRRPKKIDNEFTTREVLLAEKNDLLNQIQYLQDQIKAKRKSIQVAQEEKAKKIDESIAFQQRFSDMESTQMSKKRYQAEAKITKLSEIIEKLENRYGELTVQFAPDRELSLKTDIIFQRRQISLLKHDVEEITRKHDELQQQIESDDFEKRVELAQKLKQELSDLKSELKAEKNKNIELSNELKTIQKLYPTPEKEMKQEIERLKHQLDNMNKVNDMITRKVGNRQPAAPKQNPSSNPRNKSKKPAVPVGNDDFNAHVFETETLNAAIDANKSKKDDFDSYTEEESNSDFESDNSKDEEKQKEESKDFESDNENKNEDKEKDDDFESDKDDKTNEDSKEFDSDNENKEENENTDENKEKDDDFESEENKKENDEEKHESDDFED